MTTYISQERITEIYKASFPAYDIRSAPDDIVAFSRAIEAAAIKAYRETLVAGVVLPEPTEWHVPNGIIEGYTADQLRQAVADALAKQVPQDETWKLIEKCRDALAEELSFWDIDPPLAHVKEAHDNCVAWLAAAPDPKEIRCQDLNHRKK